MNSPSNTLAIWLFGYLAIWLFGNAIAAANFVFFTSILERAVAYLADYLRKDFPSLPKPGRLFQLEGRPEFVLLLSRAKMK